MADQTDKLKKGLLKDILKEMKGANERFEKIAQAEADTAAEGKGAIAGGFARLGARQRVAKEYMMATKGTLNRRRAIFEGMGLDNAGALLDKFFPEKREEASPELLKKFGLDKKSEKESRGGIGKLAKPLSLILRNVIETKKMVKTIEKSMATASASKSNRYFFDPRMGSGGRYVDLDTNKIVSSKDVRADVKAERTSALTAAIGADEQPLVQLKENLDSRFEELNNSMKNIKMIKDTADSIKFSIDGIIPRVADLSVHSKLDLLLKKSALDGIDVDTPDGKNKKKPPGRIKQLGQKVGRYAMRAVRFATSAPALAAAGAVAATGATAYAINKGMTDIGNEAKSAMDALEKKYGLKTIYDAKGNATGYVINGKKFGLNDLPQEYKDLILAYGPGDKRNAAAREAIARIKSNPEKYRMLEMGYKPKSAGMTIPEPSMLPAPAVSVKAPSVSTAPTSPVTAAVSAVKSTVQKAVSAGGQATMATGAAVAAGAKTGVEKVKDIIVSAAKRVGVNPGIMLAMGQQESSFNPSAQPYIKDKKTGERKLLSSAKGIFQFINSTWDAMVKKYSAQYPELLKGAFDPEANALAGALYVKENSEFLKKRGVPITGTSIYATHFLGPGGAAKLFSASKEANASAVMPQAAASNPHIFFDKGRPKTVQEVIDTLYKKVGSKAEAFQAQVDSGKIGLAEPTQPMLASTAPAPSVSPAPKTSGVEATQQSRQYDTNKMVASNAPAPAPVVINNNTGNNKMPPQAPKQALPMASTRPSENTFNRATSRDFNHPTAFTSSIVA